MQIHHFLVDDDDDGSEEECDPFDQRKKERDQIKRKEKQSLGWRKDVPFDGHCCLWIVNERDSERETK